MAWWRDVCRRIAAASDALPVPSLEAYFSDDAYFSLRLDRYDDLAAGRVVLALPDGSRWVQVHAFLDETGRAGENRFARRLVRRVREAGHAHCRTLLNAATLDLARVFCADHIVCTACGHVLDVCIPKHEATMSEAEPWGAHCGGQWVGTWDDLRRASARTAPLARPGAVTGPDEAAP